MGSIGQNKNVNKTSFFKPIKTRLNAFGYKYHSINFLFLKNSQTTTKILKRFFEILILLNCIDFTQKRITEYLTEGNIYYN